MSDYEKVASVIRYIAQHQRQQPTLDELAATVQLSPFHFQRMFVRWAGVTPKKFLQCLTVQAARQQLERGTSVLETALSVGLSGPSRLHDLAVSLEAATPGEIKAGGAGWALQAGFSESPFGKCFVAKNPRGVCWIEFVEEANRGTGQRTLASRWPNASVQWNDDRASEIIATMFHRSTSAQNTKVPLRCLVNGTEFQVRVWQALLRIPPGHLATYGQIARAIGKPKATRAVGSAIGKNPIAYLIPCHRVIRSSAVAGDYRWGTERKQALVASEIAKRGLEA